MGHMEIADYKPKDILCTISSPNLFAVYNDYTETNQVLYYSRYSRNIKSMTQYSNGDGHKHVTSNDG